MQVNTSGEYIMRMIFHSRKGFQWAGLLAFLLIIGLVVAFSSVATRECTKDTQCGEAGYCGSDFACHKVPVVSVSKTEYHSDFTQAAALLSISIVVAALILKKRQ